MQQLRSVIISFNIRKLQYLEELFWLTHWSDLKVKQDKNLIVKFDVEIKMGKKLLR